MAKGEKAFRNRASAFKLFGKGRKRRKEEEAAAKADFERQMGAYKSSETLGNQFADTPDFSANHTTLT